jgi:hypothetical protein
MAVAQLHCLIPVRGRRPIKCSSAFDIGNARAYPAAAPYCGPPSATSNYSVILQHQSRALLLCRHHCDARGGAQQKPLE